MSYLEVCKSERTVWQSRVREILFHQQAKGQTAVEAAVGLSRVNTPWFHLASKEKINPLGIFKCKSLSQDKKKKKKSKFVLPFFFFFPDWSADSFVCFVDHVTFFSMSVTLDISCFFNVPFFSPWSQNMPKTGKLNVRLDPRKITSNDYPDVDSNDFKIGEQPKWFAHNCLHKDNFVATHLISLRLMGLDAGSLENIALNAM